LVYLKVHEYQSLKYQFKKGLLRKLLQIVNNIYFLNNITYTIYRNDRTIMCEINKMRQNKYLPNCHFNNGIDIIGH